MKKRGILKLLLSNIELGGKNIIFTIKKPFDTLVFHIKWFFMAGPAGFEPANDGTKTRCLTTWRRSNRL